MSAAVQLPLDTVEDVAEAFDALARNPSIEMKVRTNGLATIVVLFQGSTMIGRGTGRGLANALANALDAVGEAGVEP